MSLAAQNTEKGADFAAQAVAKVAITMNPEVAFPGQRVRLVESLYVFGKLPTYPSPKPTVCPKCQCWLYCGVGGEGIGEKFC